jgi:replicative superfamily II helicase
MGGLDFSRIGQQSTADSATEPRRIFTTLPSKDQRYAYARDVQSEVWEAWHGRRTERDLVIKMNTGGGKTVVGLVILKSCLNEGAGPAVYITPDVYLAQQVREEARRLGIETTDDPQDAGFLSSQAILIANVYKLFNGRSVFGVQGGYRPLVEIGTILVDDAHACITTGAVHAPDRCEPPGVSEAARPVRRRPQGAVPDDARGPAGG